MFYYTANIRMNLSLVAEFGNWANMSDSGLVELHVAASAQSNTMKGADKPVSMLRTQIKQFSQAIKNIKTLAKAMATLRADVKYPGTTRG